MLIGNSKTVNHNIHYHFDKYKQVIGYYVEHGKTNRHGIMFIEVDKNKNKLMIVFQLKKLGFDFLNKYYDKIVNIVNENYKGKYSEKLIIDLDDLLENIKWYIYEKKDGIVYLNNFNEKIVCRNGDIQLKENLNRFVNRSLDLDNDYESE